MTCVCPPSVNWPTRSSDGIGVMRKLLPGGRETVWYLLADAAALVVFVLIGIRGHHASTVEGFLRNVIPLLGIWFLVAWQAHTYRRPGWRSLLRNWIVAVPIGLLVRTLIVGSPKGGKIVVFIAVGLAFTLLFLVLGRLLARIVSRGR
jgi:glycopeptide antibiotics resistance protein